MFAKLLPRIVLLALFALPVMPTIAEDNSAAAVLTRFSVPTPTTVRSVVGFEGDSFASLNDDGFSVCADGERGCMSFFIEQAQVNCDTNMLHGTSFNDVEDLVLYDADDRISYQLFDCRTENPYQGPKYAEAPVMVCVDVNQDKWWDACTPSWFIPTARPN